MMQRRKFAVQPAKYKIEKDGVTTYLSRTGFQEIYFASAGRKKATEAEISQWYKDHGYVVTKGKMVC